LDLVDPQWTAFPETLSLIKAQIELTDHTLKTLAVREPKVRPNVHVATKRDYHDWLEKNPKPTLAYEGRFYKTGSAQEAEKVAASLRKRCNASNNKAFVARVDNWEKRVKEWDAAEKAAKPIQQETGTRNRRAPPLPTPPKEPNLWEIKGVARNFKMLDMLERGEEIPAGKLQQQLFRWLHTSPQLRKEQAMVAVRFLKKCNPAFKASDLKDPKAKPAVQASNASGSKQGAAANQAAPANSQRREAANPSLQPSRAEPSSNTRAGVGVVVNVDDIVSVSSRKAGSATSATTKAQSRRQAGGSSPQPTGSTKSNARRNQQRLDARQEPQPQLQQAQNEAVLADQAALVEVINGDAAEGRNIAAKPFPGRRDGPVRNVTGQGGMDVVDRRGKEQRAKESDGKQFWNPGQGDCARTNKLSSEEIKAAREGVYSPKELTGYLRMMRGFAAPTPAERDRLWTLGRSFIASHDTTGFRWSELVNQLTQAVGAALMPDATRDAVAEMWAGERVNRQMHKDAGVAQGDLGSRKAHVRIPYTRTKFNLFWARRHAALPKNAKP